MRSVIILLIIILSFLSCKDDTIFIPKPRMYPKVDYPSKEYTKLDVVSCPFEMDIPIYFEYLKDTIQTDRKNDCWFDLYTSELNAYLHLSYLPVDNRKHFDKLIDDAFELADKHNIKADYRAETKIGDKEKNLHGLLFELEGPVATPLQFFLTDTTQHFFRGSLYFKSQVNRDSIAPVYDFLKTDVVKLVNTFEWR